MLIDFFRSRYDLVGRRARSVMRAFSHEAVTTLTREISSLVAIEDHLVLPAIVVHYREPLSPEGDEEFARAVRRADLEDAVARLAASTSCDAIEDQLDELALTIREAALHAEASARIAEAMLGRDKLAQLTDRGFRCYQSANREELETTEIALSTELLH